MEMWKTRPGLYGKIPSTWAFGTGCGFIFFVLKGAFLHGFSQSSRNFVANKTLFNIGAAVGVECIVLGFFYFLFFGNGYRYF